MKNKESPLVSIIIPVYNVEKYLRRCLESVSSQSYDNLEVILVNDGSTDRTPRICDEFSKSDLRFNVIHKSNGGQSEARNFGLNRSSGEYITFIDSDDFVHKDYVGNMLTIATSLSYDIVQCDYEYGSGSSFTSNQKHFSETKWRADELIANSKYKLTVWAKLFKSEIFKDIRFPVKQAYEDNATYYLFLNAATNVAITNRKLYYYFNRAGSTMNSNYEYYPDDFIEIFNKQIEFFSKNGKQKMFNDSIIKFCLALILFYTKCKTTKGNRNNLNKLTLTFNHNLRKLKPSNIKELRVKIILLGFRFSPSVASKLIQLFKKDIY